MDDIKKYVLMCKNERVLTFSVNLNPKAKWKIKLLEKLEHFEKAPFYGKKGENDFDLELFSFFNRRAIPFTRYNYDEILKATNSRDGFELSFKGHGLSLSNHFWYQKEDENLKYEDINFFTNDWDDSFGRAIINDDYEALKHVDLNVPDIVTPGWGIKAWIIDNKERKLYKFGIQKDNSEEAIGEVLASRMASRIFNKGEYLEYNLELINGKYASVSKAMLNIDEELVPLSVYFPDDIYPLYRSKNTNHDFYNKFFDKLIESGYKDLYTFFVKLFCFRSLVFVSDLHFDNISIIRSLKTNEIRTAPIYDLGGAYGSSRTGKEIISKINKGTLFLVFFLYGFLDPNWDYSWYDPKRLDGFEEEIKEYLSKSNFYTKELIENVLLVYKNQKSTLDEMAKKQ